MGMLTKAEMVQRVRALAQVLEAVRDLGAAPAEDRLAAWLRSCEGLIGRFQALPEGPLKPDAARSLGRELGELVEAIKREGGLAGLGEETKQALAARLRALPDFQTAPRDYRNWFRELLRDDLDRFASGPGSPPPSKGNPRGSS